jgi:hypothetical protein
MTGCRGTPPPAVPNDGCQQRVRAAHGKRGPSMGVDLWFDVDSLTRAKSGAVWGGVWIELDGSPFPQRHWNDMVVPFVWALLEESLALAGSGARRTTEVHFFDGPLSIELALQRADELRISAKSGGSVTGPTAVVGAAQFVRVVTARSAQIVAACRTHGWGDDADVRRLEALLKRA